MGELKKNGMEMLTHLTNHGSLWEVDHRWQRNAGIHQTSTLLEPSRFLLLERVFGWRNLDGEEFAREKYSSE